MAFVTHDLFCWGCKLHFSLTEVLKESDRLETELKISNCVADHTALDFLSTLHGQGAV
jgi:hypothetical protein